MSLPALEFLHNEAGEKEGLGEAGIETFRDTPYASCAREAGQNSRDASEALPVRMTFNVIRLPREQFPAIEQLSAALDACRKEGDGEKERDFFENATRIVNAETIPVLEIADYNTKGLSGPPGKEGTPFHSLLKGSGVSKKESETSGGSFGIGKNASFAVSDLQMVLYSTRYANGVGGDDACAAQGKVKLMSHTDADGEARRMTGYWGEAGFQAITDPQRIPTWMHRSKRGTSIYCMGFRDAQDWAERMTSSLVTNFFAAVHGEEMEFEVDAGRFLINRNTIEALLADGAIREATESAGHVSEIEFAAQLYRCLVSPNSETKGIDVPGLGKMSVRVLIDVGLPRRLAFIRNGMLITDNLQHFGHRFARFPGSLDFVALVQPGDDEARKLLKQLENPAHSELSAQRIPDPSKRSAADKAMKTLGKKLRELIRSTTRMQVEGTVIIDELAQFFADPGITGPQTDENAERSPETHTFTPPKVGTRKPVRPARGHGDEGGRPGTGAGGGDRGGGTGVGAGGGSGGSGKHGRATPVQLREVRNVIPPSAEGSARSRIIHFTPDSDGEIRVAIHATGLNTAEALPIGNADFGTVFTGTVTLPVRAGVRQRVLVTFAEPYDGPIEVSAVTAGEDTAP